MKTACLDVTTRVVEYIERFPKYDNARLQREQQQIWTMTPFSLAVHSHYWLWRALRGEGYAFEDVEQAWPAVQTYLLLLWGSSDATWTTASLGRFLL